MRVLRFSILTALIASAWLLSSLVFIGPAEAQSGYVRRTAQDDLVIVFVHGVMGNAGTTWCNTSTKACWPTMLADDAAFDGASIYLYEYPSPTVAESFSIDEIADNMRLQFDADDVSQFRSIVFVAHSMGGLAVRGYILKYRQVISKISFIYFYSTPTTGSEIASLASVLSSNPQFGKLKPMKSEDYLADIQRQWLAADLSIPSYCAYEKQKTFGVAIVSQASASSLCTRRLDPIDANHIDIVKPATVRHPSYLAFKNVYREMERINKSQESNVSQVVGLVQDQGATRSKSDSWLSSHISKETNFALQIRISVAFKNPSYNQPTFLRSFDSAEILRDTESSIWHSVVIPFKTGADIGDFESSAPSIIYSRSRPKVMFDVFLWFNSKPKSHETFTFRVGPKNWTVRLGDLRWQEKRGGIDDTKKFTWWASSATVSLLADDPDWLVLHSARTLPVSKASNSDHQMLLEVFLENRTSYPLPLTDLIIHAKYEKTIHCSVDADADAKPPRPELINIDWPAVVSEQGDIAADSSSITMEDNLVKADIHFLLESCFNDTEFKGKFPINSQVEPKKMQRIILRLKEVALTDKTTSRGELPSSLMQWDDVSVSVGSTIGVFPSRQCIKCSR